MNISSVCIQNFRKLYQCHIDFSNDTTLFVGANNSGKTSAMDALGKFLAGRPFAFNDITISNRELINQIGKQWETVACEKPNSLSEWGNLLPSLDVWLNVNPQDIHYVVGIIPTLKWRGGRLGVRLIYQPRKIEGLFTEYREAFFSARETEKAGAAEKKIRLFPNSLCEYLERYFTSSFVVKSYILDPEKFDADSPQETAFGMECLVDNPLTGIIRIDTIGAQRNLSDPEKHDGTDSDRTRLSTKIRSYYDKYLDPEKTPLPEDLEILAATEQARKIFDNNLENKFKPAIKEFLFSYEKLFGAKKQTATDLKNEKEGKDTSNRRTARLFYVACTRAMESLAVVAYSDNPELVKNTALNNGWFSEDEIQIIETQSVL